MREPLGATVSRPQAPAGPMNVEGIVIKPGQHSTTLGTVGSGKTFFNKNGLLPTASRGIIVDSETDDYPEFPNVSVKQALKFAQSDFAFFVRVPTRGSLEFDEPVMSELCEGLLRVGHDLTFLLEEVTDYSNANYIPPYLESQIRRARHQRISDIISTQRPARMSKNFYALAKHHFTFALDDYDIHATDYLGALDGYWSQIPDGSFRCLYKRSGNPDVTVLAPVDQYDWASRLARLRK